MPCSTGLRARRALRISSREVDLVPFGEDELIARLFAPLAGPGGLGLRDDAALLTPPPGHEIVATVDAIVAGVHYFADDPPDSVARKALRVNLSDLAAKGARPLGFLLTLAVSPDLSGAWLMAFAAALGADARSYGVELLGGDTVKTPGPAMLSVAMFGAAPAGRMVRRGGARPGDVLFVSGSIGDAAIGLLARRDANFLPGLARHHRDELLARYLEPRPRNALAPAMLDFAHAGMDISDGFVGDVTKMLAASGASARINLARVPLSPAARAAIALEPGLHEIALTGGDDYELLASAPPAVADRFEQAAQAAGVPLARVGEVLVGAAPPTFIGADGTVRTFVRGSFSHF